MNAFGNANILEYYAKFAGEHFVWGDANRHFSMLIPELRAVVAEQWILVQKSPYSVIVGLVLATNIGLILIYPIAVTLHEFEWISIDKAAFWQIFSVSSDGSIPEVAGYLQLAIAAAALAAMAIKSRSIACLSWVFILAYAIADDSLLIHEKAGARLGKFLPGTWGAQGQFVGELIYFAIVGAFLALLFAYFYARSEWKQRARSVLLLLPFGMLVFFAVFFDYFHESMRGVSRVVDFLAGMSEDGSELLCMSMVMLIALGLVIASYGERVQAPQVADQIGT